MDTPRIGVLINELDGVYQSELMRGLRRAARHLDVHLLCFPGSGLATGSAYWRELNIAFHMAGRVRLDGIVSFNGTFTWSASPEETLKFFDRFGDTPIVSLGNPVAGIPQIRPDNRSGMTTLVDHFIDYHGFRRIAFLAGPEHNSDARERLAAFRERCAASASTPWKRPAAPAISSDKASRRLRSSASACNGALQRSVRGRAFDKPEQPQECRTIACVGMHVSIGIGAPSRRWATS